ncbi:MAG: condensation domain-containing protein, partial [Myxococcota bacterium]
MSAGQKRLWFLDQLEPDSLVFNLPLAWVLRGELDVAALERALAEIVRRHEVLRARFVSLDDVPRQEIAAPAAIRLDVVRDGDGRTKAAWRAEIRRRLARSARRPFDLRAGELFRPTLFELDEREHVLSLLVHHIVFDAWSADVFLRELTTLYGDFAGGRSPSMPSLPALPIQYADFAIWQEGRRGGSELERHSAYWREKLGGELPVLELPGDRPRPAVLTHRGANAKRPLPRDLLDALGELAVERGATLYMVLLAAYQVLLHRYGGRGHGGQEDVVVGTVVANRNRPEIDGLIGFFANTLVLRTSLAGDPTFRELLDRVREVCLGAYEHQDVPFEELVDELQPERDLSYTPLFQTMFNLEDESGRGIRAAGLELEMLELEAQVARTDLMVSVHRRPQASSGSSVWAEYSTDLFDPETIERLLGHYESLLAAVVADPDTPVSALALMSGEERRRVLVDWNDTRVETFAGGPAGACLHELVEAQVDATPDATALVFEGERLSYRELEARANRLARRLREHGVGPETRVAVCMERSVDLVVALLAVLKAGGAYVPLDPEYPAERLAFMLADARPALALTHRRFADGLAGAPEGFEVPLLCLDEESLEEGRDGRPAPGVSAGGAAYVIYTSGSTGAPKGVVNAHRGIVNRLLWMQDAYQLDATDHILQKTPFSFDVSVWEFFWPLIAGAKLVVAKPGGHLDSTYLA